MQESIPARYCVAVGSDGYGIARLFIFGRPFIFTRRSVFTRRYVAVISFVLFSLYVHAFLSGVRREQAAIFADGCVSLYQLVQEELGGLTRFPSLCLGMGGGFQHGRHLFFPKQARQQPPLGNLFVTLLQQIGIQREKFGSSTGNLNEWLV